jgi:hypothetical protein
VASIKNAPYKTVIKLKDGSYLGVNIPIDNIDTKVKARHINGNTEKGGYIKKYHDDANSYYKNLNKSSDTISNEFNDKKHRLRIKKLKQLLTDDDYQVISSYIDERLNFDFLNIDFDRGHQEIEIEDDEIQLSFGPCSINTVWCVYLDDPYQLSGENLCNGAISLKNLTFYIDDYCLGLTNSEEYAYDDFISDEELGLDYKKLGIETEYDDTISLGITNYDEYYGTSNYY